MPALLTSISIFEYFFSNLFINAGISESSFRSNDIISHSAPSFSFAAFSFSLLRPIMIVVILFSTNFCAIARPIPDAPPVTIAIFFESFFFIMFFSFYELQILLSSHISITTLKFWFEFISLSFFAKIPLQ